MSEICVAGLYAWKHYIHYMTQTTKEKRCARMFGVYEIISQRKKKDSRRKLNKKRKTNTKIAENY